MPKVSIEAQCTLNGLKSISFPEDYPWHLKIQCTSCGEEAKRPIVVTQSDEVEGVRGAKVSIKVACKFCERKNDLKILKVHSYEAEQPEWKPILSLEVRGMQPVGLVLADVPLSIQATSGSTFEEELDSDNSGGKETAEWYGFDEKDNVDVSVEEFETRVVSAS